MCKFLEFVNPRLEVTVAGRMKITLWIYISAQKTGTANFYERSTFRLHGVTCKKKMKKYGITGWSGFSWLKILLCRVLRS